MRKLTKAARQLKPDEILCKRCSGSGFWVEKDQLCYRCQGLGVEKAAVASQQRAQGE